MRAPTSRRAGEEIVERDDAIERGLGKQGPEWEHAAGTDPEVDIATPIELRPEGRALRRTGGGARGRAPLGYRLRRDEGHGGKEQGTAEQLPHNEPPGKSDGRRADQKPHIAKGGPAICQDASTRSATIRTASPPPPPPPPRHEPPPPAERPPRPPPPPPRAPGAPAPREDATARARG